MVIMVEPAGNVYLKEILVKKQISMKTHFIWLFVLCICGIARAQVSGPMGDLLFQDTLTFDPLHEWISIPSPEENFWQVGEAQKYYLDSSFSAMPG